MLLSTLFQIQSTIILCLLYFGVYKRRERNLHVKIMQFSLIWDLLLVGQIELARGAVEKATQAMTNPLLLNFHIAIAITTVVLYGFIFYLGNRLRKGDEGVRQKHKFIGITALILRTIVYVTSYMVSGLV